MECDRHVRIFDPRNPTDESQMGVTDVSVPDSWEDLLVLQLPWTAINADRSLALRMLSKSPCECLLAHAYGYRKKEIAKFERVLKAKNYSKRDYCGVLPNDLTSREMIIECINHSVDYQIWVIGIISKHKIEGVMEVLGDGALDEEYLAFDESADQFDVIARFDGDMGYWPIFAFRDPSRFDELIEIVTNYPSIRNPIIIEDSEERVEVCWIKETLHEYLTREEGVRADLRAWDDLGRPLRIRMWSWTASADVISEEPDNESAIRALLRYAESRLPEPLLNDLKALNKLPDMTSMVWDWAHSRKSRIMKKPLPPALPEQKLLRH